MGYAADVLAERGRRHPGASGRATPPARTRSPSATRDAGGFDAEIVPVGGVTPRRAAPRRADRRAAGPAAAGVPPGGRGRHRHRRQLLRHQRRRRRGRRSWTRDTHRRLGRAGPAGAGHRHRRGRPATCPGLGLVPAVRAALARAGLPLDDLDVIELNEAFAGPGAGLLRRARPGPRPGLRRGRGAGAGASLGCVRRGPRRPAVLPAGPRRTGAATASPRSPSAAARASRWWSSDARDRGARGHATATATTPARTVLADVDVHAHRAAGRRHRRERLRQVDVRPDAQRAGAADRRAGDGRRPGHPHGRARGAPPGRASASPTRTPRS